MFMPLGVSGSSEASFSASTARAVASCRVSSSRYSSFSTVSAFSLFRPMAVAL